MSNKRDCVHDPELVPSVSQCLDLESNQPAMGQFFILPAALTEGVLK